jgi:hypothetical protein
MYVEQLTEPELAGVIEVLGENMPKCHSVLQEPHMTWPWIEHELLRWKAGE